ncbi:MAG: DUF3613 domain-containing protein [Alcaligenes faecalis]|jgi:hypothetical protein|uniref:DUF3613 domain-containing protein n=1 Tax=Alcaligenes sp. MMA TaxID=2893019 RepID=UPI001E45BD3B|nr:DUF3613 domain-containing protein [Alcaligenes sp. MMA]MCC9161871.1 DUF3613 domain-containing protein [Alcaligenes sp. MMA]MCH4223850.1 DUF3613 domain-containing protein [Alcaligenes faecalis]
MNRSRILACCTLLMASSAWAQTQAPLTGTMVSDTRTYPVNTSPAAASNQGMDTPVAAAATPAERQPYEKYRLSDEEVHPWPEVEGLPVHVQNERRHIPPRIEVGPDTRSLLSMQADPDREGKVLPVHGAAANLVWERYLNSFKHPIPEYMKERIKTNSSD